jgi:aspartate aminotransferase-like enzyme
MLSTPKISKMVKLMKEERNLIMLPGPTNVPDRVMRVMLKPIINHRGPEFSALYNSIEENLKYVFQTKNPVYVLTASGTGGVNCAVCNTINPGDKVIVPVYGVFSERMKEKVVAQGGKPIELPLEWNEAPTAEQIAQIVKKEKNVKAIAVIYNETSTGATVRELPKIGKIAKDNDILFIVDAISILGGDHLPVDEWGVDICITGSQKCLACPPGLSMVSVSAKAWEIVEKATNRPYYFDLRAIKEFAEKGHTPFTPALSIFYALEEALKMIREEGVEERIKRHETCAKAFYKAFEALKIMPYPKEKVRSNTVIAINVPSDVDDAKLRDIMKERYKVVIAGGMGKLKTSILRVGCMGTISEAETLATISAFENALDDVKYPVKIGTGIEAAKQVFHS